MSTLGTPNALASSSTVYTGLSLKLEIDERSSTLDLLKPDGSRVSVWGQTLQYAFGTQQSMLTLYFTPIGGSDPVTASYVNGQGTTVSSTQQSGSAVLTIQRPASTGVSFDIQLDQGTASVAFAASAISAPATSARMASTSTSSSMIAAGSTTTPTRTPPGPSARLQTRLVLTTVEPPPDPDARPDRETA